MKTNIFDVLEQFFYAKICKYGIFFVNLQVNFAETLSCTSQR